MLLKCDLVVLNRLAPGMEDRKTHSTIMLGKVKKKEQYEIFMTVHSQKSKAGTKYKVHENIMRVHTRFVKEGKCTLSMKCPPHDLAISKTDVCTLKRFLHILKQALNKEDIDNITGLDDILKVNSSDIEKPKTKMSVLSRKDYPLKNGFPSSLESLTINSCVLQRLDTRILKLCHLNTLDLSRNKLSTLPDSLKNLENLRCLDLSHNQIQQFPECITRGACAEGLRVVDLSSNQITYIPRRIQTMRNLNALKLNSNTLASIPHSIGSMKELRRLEVSNNQLMCLPWSFTQLNFDFLDVSGNLFREMKEGLVDVQDGARAVVMPSLMEICCRHVARKKRNELVILPHCIKEHLSSVKRCPCGQICVLEGFPFVYSFDGSQLAHTMAYNQGRVDLKVLSYLCSTKCFQLYSENRVHFQRRGTKRNINNR